MAESDAALRGILERNVAAAAEGESAGYHLNHVTVELDVSETDSLGEGLGRPAGKRRRPVRDARTPGGYPLGLQGTLGARGRPGWRRPPAVRPSA